MYKMKKRKKYNLIDEAQGDIIQFLHIIKLFSFEPVFLEILVFIF